MSSPRKSSPRINLDALAEHIQPHLESLIRDHAPQAKQEANGWRLGNVYGEKGKSTWIGERGFHDHATGEKGSHITLFSYLWSCSLIEAAKRLADLTQFPIDKYADDSQLTPVQPSVTFQELSDLHVDALQKRGFDPAFFKQLPIKTASNGALAFLHYTESGKLAFVKFTNVQEKSWWSDKSAAHQIPWLLDYVTQVHPEAQRLYITEGHWDAIACSQLGFPAVSIPNGASNHHWIEAIQNFLGSFNEIVLCYDADTAGAEALAIATSRIDKPLKVIELPDGCKDPNDVLINHGPDRLREVLRNAVDYNPPEIINAGGLFEQASRELVCDFEWDTPWGKDFKFAFRPNESTILTAHTGHGKSNVVRQIIWHLSQRYKAPSFTASFEDTPLKITNAIIQQLAGHPDPHGLLERVDLFDTTHPKYEKRRITLVEMLDLFTMLYKKRGIQFFVIDNLMCLDVSRDDFQDQANAAEMIRQWLLAHAAHLLLVAHPRKPPIQNSGPVKPPSISEIRGAGELGDMAFNVMGVARNIPKERKLDELRLNHASTPMDIKKHDSTSPDTIIQIEKQRWNGFLPTIWLWRDAAGNFHNNSTRDCVWW